MSSDGDAPEWLDRPVLADACALYARSSSHFLRVSGVDVHILDEARSGSGPTVVLLSAQWLGVSQGDRWAPELSRAGRVVRIDLPGQGLSGRFSDKDYSAPAYARLIDGVLRELEVGDHVVVGTSFSGIAASVYAAASPDRLVGLVLATTSGLPRPPGGPAPGGAPPAPHLAETREGARPRRFYRWKLSTLLRRPSADRDRERLLDEMHLFNELPGRSDEARLRAAHHDPGLLARALPEARVPMLVQWSSHSTYLPPDMADRIAALVPGKAQLRLYPDTGHLLVQDAPEDCGRDADLFLATL